MRMQPEERKQELIDIATKLFLERGYKNVSVQDILDEVNGQNGMFYHYFKSKDEIYQAAIKQFIDYAASDRLKIINNKSISFKERLQLVCEDAVTDSKGFIDIFGKDVDVSFVAEALDGFLEILVKPVGNAIIEAKKEGIIPKESIITEDNAEAAARFILYGTNSLARIRQEENDENEDAKNIGFFINEFLRI